MATHDVESYIVEGMPSGSGLVEVGTLTTIDGVEHEIQDVDGSLVIDGIDIAELNALPVNNGQVHSIVWALGEENYVTVQDRLEYIVDYYSGTSQGLHYDFFNNLITLLNETERFEDRRNNVTLVIPRTGITDAEHQLRIENGTGWATMYDEFESSNRNESFSMVPDIFLDTESAREFLLSHVIDSKVSVELLESSVGGSLQTAAGTTLEILGGHRRGYIYCPGWTGGRP